MSLRRRTIHPPLPLAKMGTMGQPSRPSLRSSGKHRMVPKLNRLPPTKAWPDLHSLQQSLQGLQHSLEQLKAQPCAAEDFNKWADAALKSAALAGPPWALAYSVSSPLTMLLQIVNADQSFQKGMPWLRFIDTLERSGILRGRKPTAKRRIANKLFEDWYEQTTSCAVAGVKYRSAHYAADRAENTSIPYNVPPPP